MYTHITNNASFKSVHYCWLPGYLFDKYTEIYIYVLYLEFMFLIILPAVQVRYVYNIKTL